MGDKRNVIKVLARKRDGKGRLVELQDGAACLGGWRREEGEMK